jgi:hypothetical protein
MKKEASDSRQTLLDSLRKLQWQLAMEDSYERNRGFPLGHIGILIMRRENIKVYMNREADRHPRGHVHVRFKHDFDAAYALDDFSRLAGEMPRAKEKTIVGWLMKHKEDLNHKWNKLNTRQGKNTFEIEQKGDGE